MTIRRGFVSVLSDRLEETRDFYVELLGFRVDFDSDWFVHLQAPENDAIELGILKRNHELVPKEFRDAPRGMMVTVVVPNVDEVRERCHPLGIDVLQEPRNEFYGQRRMLVTDPSGILVDVSSECPPSEEFLASLK